MIDIGKLKLSDFKPENLDSATRLAGVESVGKIYTVKLSDGNYRKLNVMAGSVFFFREIYEGKKGSAIATFNAHASDISPNPDDKYRGEVIVEIAVADLETDVIGYKKLIEVLLGLEDYDSERTREKKAAEIAADSDFTMLDELDLIVAEELGNTSMLNGSFA